MAELTHIGPDGRARMVDISAKADSTRIAVAQGYLHLSKDTLALALSDQNRKGNALAVAELAGIMAAKKTSDIIPLCHPLPLSGVRVEIEPQDKPTALKVTASVKTTGKTGVEMEALTAVSVACLTLYDMLKAAEKSMTISGIELVQKSGGKSGDYRKASA
mgnify:CR=1 FL=1